MRITYLSAALYLLDICPCLAGVDQGNSKAPVYHMTQDYVADFSASDLSVSPELGTSSLRVDVGITYREQGYFIIGLQPPDNVADFSLCAEQPVAGSLARLFWFGKDCKNALFARKWQDLQHGVVGLKFPQILKKE